MCMSVENWLSKYEEASVLDIMLMLLSHASMNTNASDKSNVTLKSISTKRIVKRREVKNSKAAKSNTYRRVWYVRYISSTLSSIVAQVS